MYTLEFEEEIMLMALNERGKINIGGKKTNEAKFRTIYNVAVVLGN